MQRVNTHLNSSRSHKLEACQVQPGSNSLNIPEHTPFVVSSNTRIFKHNKRGSFYYLVGHASYMSQDIGYEDDQLFSIWVEHNLIGVASLKTATQKDFELYPHVKLCSLGRLQCSTPIKQGSSLIVYRDIKTGVNWYRPYDEYFDGRYTEQEKT